MSLAGAASNVLAASAPRPAGATPLAQLEPSAAGSTVAPARTPAATASRPELIAGPASGAASPVAGSWRSIALAVLGTLLVAVVVVSALLPAAPQEPIADRTLAPAAVTPPADLGPAPGPTIAPVNLVAQRVRPPLRPDDEPIQADMGATLDRVSEPLHACAREAGRRVTVELSVEADATRFAAINVLPAEPAQDRCVRAVLEPLRFVAEPSASTFIIRYQP